MMSDYNESIDPEPTENVPLSESLRYQQERDRLFALSDPQKTFSEPDQPLAEQTFRSLLADLDPPTILIISQSSNVLTEFQWLQQSTCSTDGWANQLRRSPLLLRTNQHHL